MARCRHKIGFLSLRDCGNPVVGLCSQCNRPVCDKHQKAIEQGPVCFECYAQDMSEDEITGDMARLHHRRHYYHSTGYYPYYYGHSRRYGDDDYRYFDSDVESELGHDEDIDPEDFQDS
ncbi:hypothetical protein ACFL27_06390 [candidate division CSSED10-310 bacterium]|uniref:CHY-type domain-containing protein n=1 Tax=candidate division CSSED10-310 bacterium TaxID=2855610 RepID=A0ABV6YUE0_UNCC1